MKPSALIYDWDGVLADTHQIFWEINLKVCEHFGVAPVAFEQYLLYCFAPFEDLYSKGCGINATMEEVQEVFKPLVLKYEHVPLFLETKKCIQRGLDSGIPQFIVSACQPNLIEATLNRRNQNGAFDGVLCGWHDKVSALKQLSAHYDVALESAVFFGDSFSDMRDATSAGTVPIGIARYECLIESLKSGGARYLFPTLTEAQEAVFTGKVYTNVSKVTTATA